MIRVVVEDEKGNERSQDVNVPADLISHPDDLRFTCLRFVDPYGDTVFNHMQLTPLLEDLRLLRLTFDVIQHEDVIQRVERLVQQCRSEPHLYLRLIGD